MNYRDEYQNLIKLIDSGAPVPAETVGQLIVKFAQYFSDAINIAVKAEQAFNIKLVEFEKSDDINGKPLSSTKAEAFAKATPEYLAYNTAKGELASIEQCINALKSMQKSLQNEFGYNGI